MSAPQKIVLSFDCANQTLGLVIAAIDPLNIGDLRAAAPAQMLRKLNGCIRILFIECAYVCAASDSLPARAAALRAYLERLDGIIAATGVCPTDVILEDQTINHLSGGVMYQLAFHYSHLNIHIVSPRLKNKVCFAPHLVYSTFLAKYKTRSSANKAHTRANMTAWLNVFCGSATATYKKYGITKGLEQHVADAFMQMMAAWRRLGVIV